MNTYDVLKRESVMLIGEKFPSRVKWIQLYDASDSIEERDMRDLLISISQHIARDRIPSGSARKFLDGKLVYFHKAELQETTQENKVYCIFTRETDVTTVRPVKAALREIALRGGVYSAKRFFEEVMELVENPDKMRSGEQLSAKEALARIDHYDHKHMDANELGYLISIIDRSADLDQFTLENIYFHVYETIQELAIQDNHISDPDEFLDAAYLIATRYQETNNFHLALELYKQIIPIAGDNRRFDLEATCRISIATIYKNFFPRSGKFILEILKPITNKHLQEINAKQLEIYYCLLGHAYAGLDKSKRALKYFEQAIGEAEQETNSPLWIAEAYEFMGTRDEEDFMLKDSTRHYLTAATIAFSAGDIPMADYYRNKSAQTEILIANSIMHTALVNHMDSNTKEAEYRAWEALRILIKTYMHVSLTHLFHLQSNTEEILSHARIVLDIQGKKRKNRDLLSKIEKIAVEMQLQTITPGIEQERLNKLAKEVEENIPLPPPTFLLLSVDGRLITMGRITDEGWDDPGIEGTLLSGILSAIMSLITEVSEEVTSLRTVDAGNVQIMIEQSDNAVAALLVDRDISEFRKRLVRLIRFIDHTYGEDLKLWDGSMKIFDNIKHEANQLLAPSVVAANIDEYN